MKWILFSIGWLLACILLAALLVYAIRKKRGMKRRWIHVIWTVLASTILMAATGAVYLSVYYHHDASAEPFLVSGERVAVSPFARGLMFDGPSDSRAVIFYPGAKVEAEAYAPLMYKIAEEWGDCFLVEMPANMAMLDADAAEDIQQEHHYDQWYLAGHSLGGVTAATYLQEHPEDFSGLILLAAYSTGQLSEDLQVASLYGDQDGVLNREEYEKNRNHLPDNAEERIIAGGNHAQFGNYGDQSGDGTAVISREEQQQQVIQALKSMTNEENILR